MRYVYCAACGRVSRNYRFEGDRCFYCGAQGEIVNARSAWQFYAGSALFVVAAIAFVLAPIQDEVLKWLFLILVLGGSVAFSQWGLSLTKSRILRSKTGPAAKEEQA